MSHLYLIRPVEISKKLDDVLNSCLPKDNITLINESTSLPDLKNKKIIFAVDLDETGFCIPVFNILTKIKSQGIDALSGASGAIIVCSKNDLFTKSISRQIIFIANQLGCSFMGHPVVEIIQDFKNFRTWKKTMDLPLAEICNIQAKRLMERLQNDSPAGIDEPKILIVHSSSSETSNTLMLWNMVKEGLRELKIQEFKIENGEILDCKGCSFTSCIYFSKQQGCFYGGIMTDQIYPALEKSNILILICPNYNDALSANLTAFINRLTALYRRISFYDKTIFSVIVSGNSGSDSVAMQIIDALNINKGFRLPPYFSLMDIANDPGSIKDVPGINNKAMQFAKNILLSIKIKGHPEG